jgi:alpha-1,3-glucosyltransferase
VNYFSGSTLIFQKFSVAVTDLLFIVASWFLFSEHVSTSSLYKCGFFFLAALNSSLFLVDHIHFQYNGILMGLMVLLLWTCWKRDTILVTSCFSVLLLMKHLFAPLAPIFAVVVLNHVSSSRGLAWRLKLLLQIFFIALGFLFVAFFPFVRRDGKRQLSQIVSRLFPFGRGLVHAYWAPNFWGFYLFMDKMLAKSAQYMGYDILLSRSHGFSSSGGKVGVFSLSLLPNIEASHCLSIVATGILLFSVLLLGNFSFILTLRCLAVSSLFSFMFGYHVHEKAIIITLLLQMFLGSFSGTSHKMDLLLFRVLSLSAVVSLFPLIPGKLEWIIKGMLLISSFLSDIFLVSSFFSYFFFTELFFTPNNYAKRYVIAVVDCLSFLF